jgi:hypothetical protein
LLGDVASLALNNRQDIPEVIGRQNIENLFTALKLTTLVIDGVQEVTLAGDLWSASASVVRLLRDCVGNARAGRNLNAGSLPLPRKSFTVSLGDIKRTLGISLEVFPCRYLTLDLGDAGLNVTTNLLTPGDKLGKLVDLSLNALTGNGINNRRTLDLTKANLSLIASLRKLSNLALFLLKIAPKNIDAGNRAKLLLTLYIRECLFSLSATTTGIRSLPLKGNAASDFFGTAPGLPLNVSGAKCLFCLSTTPGSVWSFPLKGDATNDIFRTATSLSLNLSKTKGFFCLRAGSNLPAVAALFHTLPTSSATFLLLGEKRLTYTNLLLNIVQGGKLREPTLKVADGLRHSEVADRRINDGTLTRQKILPLSHRLAVSDVLVDRLLKFRRQVASARLRRGRQRRTLKSASTSAHDAAKHSASSSSTTDTTKKITLCISLPLDSKVLSELTAALLDTFRDSLSAADAKRTTHGTLRDATSEERLLGTR